VKLYVKVIAFSEEDGLKSTKEQLIEIPAKARKMVEAVFGNDPSELLNSFATLALVAALGSADSNVQAQQAVAESVNPRTVGQPTTAGTPPKPDIFGLNDGLRIMEAMEQKERAVRAHAPQARGPGPIGFGHDRGR
jgi:hypothetical protein